jgi:hypothetical protein
MSVIESRYLDPFAPVLFSSPPLTVTIEQQEYIKDILRKACSDSRFAEKAYLAILGVLTMGNTEPPVITSLNPSSATIGDPAFDLHVIGSGFDQNSVIYFNGLEEPTTLNSPTDVSTGINMPLWTAPAVVPVSVRNSNGIVSQSQNFEFIDSVTRQTTVVKTPNFTAIQSEKK